MIQFTVASYVIALRLAKACAAMLLIDVAGRGSAMWVIGSTLRPISMKDDRGRLFRKIGRK
jgi:hypothetical protein